MRGLGSAGLEELCSFVHKPGARYSKARAFTRLSSTCRIANQIQRHALQIVPDR